MDFRRKSDGNSALFVAAEYSDRKTIKLLINKYKTDVNVRNSSQSTPLFYAVLKNRQDNLETLAEMNANFNLKNNRNSSVLHVTASTCDSHTISYLVKQHNLCVNAINNDSCNPLYYACVNIRLGNIVELLKLGADADAELFWGMNLLHVAAQCSDESVITLLAEKQLSVNVRDKHNSTPLFYACESNHFNNVRLLIERLGADINLKTIEG